MNMFRAALAALALSGAAVGSQAYSGITIFGDSLSDTGNVFLATGGAIPPPPYFNGRFSDGLVWVDHLAAGLGSAATPSLAGGNNYAFGGARTGSGVSPVPGLLAQTAGLWAPSLGGPADPNRLYVLVGGGNDMRDARTAFQTNSAADQAGRAAAAAVAANNLAISLNVLANAGAKHVLMASMPNLGRTPEAAGLGLVDASTDASNQYNNLFPSLLGYGASLGLNMMFVDMAGLSDQIFNDALNNGGAQFGITNVTVPCFLSGDCKSALFSDDLHPSARAHELLGQYALLAVGVPEPQTYALMALGLVAIGFVARRRRA